jgi:hypothetical protein
LRLLLNGENAFENLAEEATGSCPHLTGQAGMPHGHRPYLVRVA